MKQNAAAEQLKQRKSLAAAEREENQRFVSLCVVCCVLCVVCCVLCVVCCVLSVECCVLCVLCTGLSSTRTEPTL